MQVLVIHDTETEESIGMVHQQGKEIDFDKFDNAVRKTWTEFNRAGLAEDYSIEDFVDYHNENSKVKIDYVVSDFIQLAETDLV